jgi:hypothetical protein
MAFELADTTLLLIANGFEGHDPLQLFPEIAWNKLNQCFEAHTEEAPQRRRSVNIGHKQLRQKS